MRALLPEALHHLDLHTFYADKWLDVGGVRVNMISSVDGAASAAGLSAGLQTPGDNRVFAVLRDLADVVLVGSGTVIAEDYGALRLSPDRLAVRAQFGLAPQLPIAVASRSLTFDLRMKLFADAAHRPLVLTCAAADSDRRQALERVADVVVTGEHDIEPAAARQVLAERGLSRVLCEGGPTLFGRFAMAGAVDELCLSLAPMLTGPGAPRIIGGSEWAAGPRRFALSSLLEEDGALFLRLTAARD